MIVMGRASLIADQSGSPGCPWRTFDLINRNIISLPRKGRGTAFGDPRASYYISKRPVEPAPWLNILTINRLWTRWELSARFQPREITPTAIGGEIWRWRGEIRSERNHFRSLVGIGEGTDKGAPFRAAFLIRTLAESFTTEQYLWNFCSELY